MISCPTPSCQSLTLLCQLSKIKLLHPLTGPLMEQWHRQLSHPAGVSSTLKKLKLPSSEPLSQAPLALEGAKLLLLTLTKTLHQSLQGGYFSHHLENKVGVRR
jgi:hypothetical protein